MPAPRDDEIVFYVQLYRDFELAWYCLARLRRIYPGSRICLVSDGDPDPRYPALARRFRAEYTEGERLYAVGCGGRMHQRMLDLYLAAPAPWLVKVDTDARFHRRLRHAPSGRAVFGTLEHRTVGTGTLLDPPNIHGGVLGITLEAARDLRDSGVFLSPELLDPASSWASCPDALLRASHGLVSFDFLLRWACLQRGIPTLAHDEIFSIWRGKVRNPRLRYSATHPHKRIPRLWKWRIRWGRRHL